MQPSQDRDKGWLRRHLQSEHGVPASEALDEATMTALESRHVLEHFEGWRENCKAK